MTGRLGEGGDGGQRSPKWQKGSRKSVREQLVRVNCETVWTFAAAVK